MCTTAPQPAQQATNLHDQVAALHQAMVECGTTVPQVISDLKSTTFWGEINALHTRNHAGVMFRFLEIVETVTQTQNP